MIEGIVLHIPGDAQPSIGLRLAIAAAAGALATLGMSVFMRTRPHGYVPPSVAAAAVLRRSPKDVSRPAAGAVHLLAGILAAITFEGLLVGYERVREPLGIGVEVVIADLVTLSEVVALALVVGVLYAVFSRIVFPRHGGTAFRTAADPVRRAWARSVVIYGVTLLASVTLVYTIVL